MNIPTKMNKRLYIVTVNDGYETPLSFDNGVFVHAVYCKKRPVPVYTKKAAKGLIKIDHQVSDAAGRERKEYVILPLGIPCHYMIRPLSSLEQEDQETNEALLLKFMSKRANAGTYPAGSVVLPHIDLDKVPVSTTSKVMIYMEAIKAGEITPCKESPDDGAEDWNPLVAMHGFQRVGTHGVDEVKEYTIPIFSPERAAELIDLQEKKDVELLLPDGEWRYFAVPVAG